MKRYPLVTPLPVGIVAGLLLLAACVARPPFTASTSVQPVATVGPSTPTLAPTPTRAIVPWRWPLAGFSSKTAMTLTQGIERYTYYDWSVRCDAPARHQVPMIWGRRAFYMEREALAELFNGPCNDGRPLLFLNEPAKAEQANISPAEAANMFYTMTRGADWPYQRWHGPIYVGNNLVEDQAWDAEFVRQFAASHNNGKPDIREIAGWGVHLYGNYEYGEKAGDPSTVWTGDIPSAEIPAVVDRSMRLLDKYLAQRKAEGNSTSLVATEFGLLQSSHWHDPYTFYYTTTAAFMEEYVRRFDVRPEIQAWHWFLGSGAKDEFLDTDLMVDAKGVPTPNGVKWRELARKRQP